MTKMWRVYSGADGESHLGKAPRVYAIVPLAET